MTTAAGPPTPAPAAGPGTAPAGTATAGTALAGTAPAGTATSTVRLRPVFCVIGHEHRSRQAADDAVEGRFTCAGTTLDIGPEPDWLHDGLPQDEEWRIEWSKFYVGLDLAEALRRTGDRRYLTTWEGMVASWTDQVPVGSDPSDVTGRRLQNWVYAWQAFDAAGAPPSDDTVELLVWSIREQLAHLVQHVTPERNHRTLELYAVLVVALALPELDPDGRLAREAWAALHRNLLDDVWADGVHRECSTHYHLIALRSFVGARENARRAGLPVPPGYDERLALACRYAMHVTRPDGTIPALSDSDTGDYADLLALASTLVDVPGLAWVATRGAVGRPPRERGPDFARGGLSVQRSGWGQGTTGYTDERFLVLDAGPIGDGGHGHYDALSIEAYAWGRPLVVDPGRYTYSEEPPNWRHWFKGTAAHNTVTVDDADQTPYRRGKPAKGTAASARLVQRRRADGVDLLVADVTSVAYDARHTRQVAFVADGYWVVVDTLTAPTGSAHEYCQRFHLPPAAWHATTVRPRTGDVLVTAPGVALLLPAGSAPSLQPGWVSGTYGLKEHAPVVAVTSHAVPRACLVAVLWPLQDDAPEPPQLDVVDGARDGDHGVLRVRLTGTGHDAADVDELTLPAVRADGTVPADAPLSLRRSADPVRRGPT
jgi:uncharacterized heparinase superfamily protein